MPCLFFQIGLGFDSRGMDEFIWGIFIWFIGFVAGLIGFALSWISGPRIREARVVFCTIMLLTAMILWAICIWAAIMYGHDSGVAQFMPVLALLNTSVGAGILFLPARR